MSAAKTHIEAMVFPSAAEFITIMASWNLSAIMTILKRLSIAQYFDSQTETIQSDNNNKWNVIHVSPLLFRLTTAEALDQLLSKQSKSESQYTMTCNDIDQLFNAKSELIRGDILEFIAFLIYCRCFHSHHHNPYISTQYTAMLSTLDQNIFTQYLSDISHNFVSFPTLLLNHKIRFKLSLSNKSINRDFIGPLNQLMDFEFHLQQFTLYPIECIERISTLKMNALSQTHENHEDIHHLVLLVTQYAALQNDAQLMISHRFNDTKLMFIISNLSSLVDMHHRNTQFIYFTIQKALFIILRYVRFHYAMDSKQQRKPLNLSQLQHVFAYVLNDKDHVLDPNLSALIFMIASHSLMTKLIHWKFTDYSGLNGLNYEQKTKQMKSPNGSANDIGYLLYVCLHNKEMINHSLNIPKSLIIHYIHQCLLYISPYTISIHELIHILLNNIHTPTNNNTFDETFFTSYCVLFRSIAQNINKVMNVPPTQEYKSIQTLCSNHISTPFSDMKQKLQFKGNEVLFIGYVSALCGILSTKKTDASLMNDEWKEAELSLNTRVQTEISYVMARIQSTQNMSNTGNALQLHKWSKSIMSVMGILCHFNPYFIKTSYIEWRSFYFMDFMFDVLLQSLIEMKSVNGYRNDLFVSYLTHSSFAVAKLMAMTTEHHGSFSIEDINSKQYTMIQRVSEYINKYIWSKDRDDLSGVVAKNGGIIWYSLLQILHQFSIATANAHQMISVAVSAVQIEHMSYTHPIRTQLMKKLSSVMNESANTETMLMPFLSEIKVIDFDTVEDKPCAIPVSKAYKSRDLMVIHLLCQCIERIVEKPSVLSSHIIPYLHLYGNNELMLSDSELNKAFLGRVHHLYSLTVQYLPLRWEYLNISKHLYDYKSYANYYEYYVDQLLIAKFPEYIDYAVFSQSFNATFSFDIDIKDSPPQGPAPTPGDIDMESGGAVSKFGNVVFTDNKKNNRLTQFHGEPMTDLFNTMCINTMSKLVHHVTDHLQLSVRYQFGENIDDMKGFETMIVNVCKLIMVANCMDNMIKVKDLNYGLFLCKQLFNLSLIKNNINTQNQVLMRQILLVFSEIISKCNNLTRKDHCLKWFFDLTEDIDWNSKL
eukprot:991463_1